jgi:hypothetical protein
MEPTQTSNSTPLNSKVMEPSPTYKSINQHRGISFDKQSLILFVASIFFMSGLGFWFYVNFLLK